MYKYILFLSVFLFACKKKNTDIPRINLAQQPSKISVFETDTGSNTEHLNYFIRYAYDTLNNRFDSINISNAKQYVFDYTQFAAEKMVVAKYNTVFGNSDRIYYNPINNTLYKYATQSTPTIDSTLLSFDSLSQIQTIQFASIVPSQNFSWSFKYTFDTIFKQMSFNTAACNTVDTIITTYKKFNNQLPYLLFINYYNSCTIELPTNLLLALPTSVNYYKIPTKAWSNNVETYFTYTADAQGRLATFTAATFRKNDMHLLKKVKFVLEY
ncbi:MAG TPA: hypothetical protein PKM51_01635 [Chitinophagales bacterium]|nr:hypothetical protein [Chitinophagales bacterium]